MPRKSEKPPCELCCGAFEKGQDVLKCEGECGCVVHRYCAGVTKRHFESLSKGSIPFVCQWCSLRTSKAVIEQLQSMISSLQSELAATKEALAKQNELTTHTPSPSPDQSYAAAVVSRPTGHGGRQHHRRQRQRPAAAKISNTTATATQSSTSAAGNTATTEISQTRVKVEGARRIWGTLPHATTRTVQNAIDRFCNVHGLRIKRKTSRSVHLGKTSWWFVVHADEPVLRELDEKWESLSTQTSWILKPCSKPADIENHASDSSSPPTENSATPDNQQTSDEASLSTSNHPHAADDILSSEPTVKEKPSHQVDPGSGDE